MSKLPYIKPTRYVHSSGYRTFEVGYCEVENGQAVNIEVLGNGSDHIFTDCMALVSDSKPFAINIDLTKNGYIHFFSHQGRLAWDSDTPMSSAGLILVERRK